MVRKIQKDICFLGILCLFLSGCAMQRAAQAEAAQRTMVGLSKEQIFSCMGLAKRKGKEGTKEIWAYQSGNGYVEKDKRKTSFSEKHSWNAASTEALTGVLGFDSETQERRFCDIHIVFEKDRVETVNYVGPTGGFLTQDEQCAYAVRNCVESNNR